MKRRPCYLHLFPVLLMTGTAAYAQIDLTPVETTREVDGVRMSSIVFRDGRQEISYSPPSKWRLSGSGPKLSLTPDAVPNADAQVEVKTIVTAVPIDQANLQNYVLSARQSAPRTARNVEVLDSRINPLKICGYDTLAIDMQYEAFGATYRSHLLYLNRKSDQWIFRFTAPVKSFQAAFEPFRVSLYSLTGL
jgi:hypothetical protein